MGEQRLASSYPPFDLQEGATLRAHMSSVTTHVAMAPPSMNFKIVLPEALFSQKNT